MTRSESERLRGKLGLVVAAVADASRRIVEHEQVRELYPEYLFTSHCIIRASVPLMETARSTAEASAGRDPVSAAIAPYLEGHIVEELHHDDWLLDDLELLGRTRDAVLARPPSPTVAAFVGAQYYWALHFHPVAVLGYIALLEGYPPSPALIDELVMRTGHERAAFRTLIAHAELDPGHSEELFDLIDTLPLTPEQSAVLGLSAISSVHLLAQAFGEVVAGAAPAS